MATWYYAERVHNAQTQTQIPTSYFCIAQESKSKFASVFMPWHVTSPSHARQRSYIVSMVTVTMTDLSKSPSPLAQNNMTVALEFDARTQCNGVFTQNQTKTEDETVPEADVIVFYDNVWKCLLWT